MLGATNSSSPFATKYNIGEMAAAANVEKGNVQKISTQSFKVADIKVTSSMYRFIVYGTAGQCLPCPQTTGVQLSLTCLLFACQQDGKSDILSLSSVSTDSSDRNLAEKEAKIEPEKKAKIEPEKEAKIEPEKKEKIETEKESAIETKMESKTEFSAVRPAWSRNDDLASLKSEPEPEPEPELEVDIEVMGGEGETACLERLV